MKKEKKARRIERKTVVLLCCGDGVALRQRPEKGLLAGLWEPLAMQGHLSERQVREVVRDLGGSVLDMAALPKAKHVFTHVEWHMTGWRVSLRSATGCRATGTGRATRREGRATPSPPPTVPTSAEACSPESAAKTGPTDRLKCRGAWLQKQLPEEIWKWSREKPHTTPCEDKRTSSFQITAFMNAGHKAL